MKPRSIAVACVGTGWRNADGQVTLQVVEAAAEVRRAASRSMPSKRLHNINVILNLEPEHRSPNFSISPFSESFRCRSERTGHDVRMTIIRFLTSLAKVFFVLPSSLVISSGHCL